MVGRTVGHIGKYKLGTPMPIYNLAGSHLNKVLWAAEGNQLSQNALDEITQLSPAVLYHPDIYPALRLCYFYLNSANLLKYIKIPKKLLPILLQDQKLHILKLD